MVSEVESWLGYCRHISMLQEVIEPLALDMRSMGKGQVWINGQSLGRYWMAYAKGDCGTCSYSGTFRPPKCQSGCGQPTQRWYHSQTP